MKQATLTPSRRRARIKPRKRLETIAQSLAYRTPKQVTDIRQLAYGDQYAVCPGCNHLLDREYMAFCDTCGQRLSWCNFTKARVHKQRWV